ncbi:hypothetical protein TPY_3635 [Sulfobacillus acidophilus TPY]|nr:hypothetical protein TPY_3635 [Sulfobacillus acidophilus TPY]
MIRLTLVEPSLFYEFNPAQKQNRLAGFPFFFVPSIKSHL